MDHLFVEEGLCIWCKELRCHDMYECCRKCLDEKGIEYRPPPRHEDKDHILDYMGKPVPYKSPNKHGIGPEAEARAKRDEEAGKDSAADQPEQDVEEGEEESDEDFWEGDWEEDDDGRWDDWP
jgi:hypothetical protein